MRFIVLAVLTLAVAFTPGLARRVDRKAIGAFRLRRVHPIVQGIAFCALVVVGILLVQGLMGRPFPHHHDEFSYLLLADTLAEGRLANPSHPFQEHFETFHVLPTPTYASKYPVGQGVFLAAGQVVAGDPLVGVWLSAILAVLAILWMLRQWLPPRWACVGTFLFALQVAVPSYWTHSYWGGHVAVIGGALVAGSARNLARHALPVQALIFGLGSVILAGSRPYEGLVLVGAMVAYVVAARFSQRGLRGLLVPKLAVLTAVGPILIGGLGMAYYNQSVTGNWLTMPYSLYQQRYHQAPIFLVQSPSPSSPHELPQMRKFHKGELSYYQQQRDLAGAAEQAVAKLKSLLMFFMPRGLGVLLLVVPFLLLRRSTRAPTVICGGLVAASLLPVFLLEHYVAPYSAMIALFLTQAIRRLRVMNPWRRPIGRALAALLILWIVVSVAAATRYRVANPDPSHLDRAAIAEELYADDRRHLVLVEYGPTHCPHREWVYNRADIDGSKVVWAHDFGPDRNLGLRGYFRDRVVWRLYYDSGSNLVRLTPEP